MNISELYICSTYYHVFISLIKALLNKEKSDIVICDDIPEYKNLICSLIRSGCFQNVYFFDRSSVAEVTGRSKLDWLLFQHKRSRKSIEKAFKIDVKRYENVFIYHDDIILGRYLQDIKKRYCLTEDAKDFFGIIKETQFARLLPSRLTLKYKIKRFIGVGYYPMGQSKYLKYVEVNDKSKISIPLRNVIECNRDELVKRLSEEQKKLIYEVFFSESYNIEIGEKKSVLVLTEPFLDDGRIKKIETQVQIYRDIIDSYVRKGYYIYIKPHPRDRVDYTSNFESCYVINKNCPIEIMEFNKKVNFDTAVTITSTAINSIRFAKELVVLGSDFLENYFDSEI